ncbi:M1 family metallopeptidase [Hymenobacter sp. NBH84]|uniref:M1 family aminopeptidase n=1 Tax=Hymenobacter sp. NBH84 TaxID=2596915 RepID=UPI001629CC6B|nr:M1 family aminopeptidase [Hymenobacter sp. NBH84]QNE39365.1 M1 family metallopeptidase [Hymenobacter sp. NBH84]
MKASLLLIGLLVALVIAQTCQATPVVEVQLQLEPKTHAFTCRYTWWIAPTDTTTSIAFNLNRRYHLARLQTPGADQQRVLPRYYPYFADTLQRIAIHYPKARIGKARQITLTYSGTLAKSYYTEQVNVFSAHSGWLPMRAYHEYDVVDYTLRVRAPAAYKVRSTSPGLRHRSGQWTFRGITSAIEITALVASQFNQLPPVASGGMQVVKVGGVATQDDAALLQQAEAIRAFYNRTLGRQDSITHFTIFLPGTNTDAFGLLDNATIITYTDFDVKKPDDLLILAHEISHKWWSWGSIHNENDWLNEAFATYSSLLYLQASGDTATYRTRLAQLAQSAAGTPAILGFNRYQYEPTMYRRVIYNKGTVVLAALHARLGSAKYFDLLATVAGRKICTTKALLATVEEVAGSNTRAWLLAELSQ